MHQIGLVTDSTCDLRENILLAHGIKVIPLNVHFGDELYKDQVDIFPEEFFHKLEETAGMPKTSQPAPGEFVEVYKELLRSGCKTIISLHLSSHLSGTIGSAQLAKSLLPEADIRVVDSLNVSMGLGLLVIEAAKARAAGMDADNIVRMLEEQSGKTQLLFTLETLEYLQRNGRIGKASAVLGSLLNIKPILQVTEGAVGVFEKCRGKAKAVKRMLEVLVETVKKSGPLNVVGVLHSEDFTSANKLRLDIIDLGLAKEVIITEIGPVVGVHAGPEAVGIAFIN